MEEGPRRLESASEASASVMRLKLEVEEKKQAMALLQRALAQQRDLTIRRVKETEKELGRQLRQQREHYEATIQRHLSFIDQEMKKLKELMSATEKVRREKWMNEKTRKIKEITVRGGRRLAKEPHVAREPWLTATQTPAGATALRPGDTLNVAKPRSCSHSRTAGSEPEAWLLSRERELKEEIRRGRDKDIELVIRRLEAVVLGALRPPARGSRWRVSVGTLHIP
ncbi:PREDICTED: centrosomal protein of 131 kDa [Myotis brandtii]|uniref:centrosomal protein of 131 kDa n=1 Tax=Myotis brandtii TaxID=109478 RepID=UPI0007047907|nr:PREDICTED: centrosomal protein of 131 kDa [Myotis brandtii]